jgi:hypothetical protein
MICATEKVILCKDQCYLRYRIHTTTVPTLELPDKDLVK